MGSPEIAMRSFFKTTLVTISILVISRLTHEDILIINMHYD